MPVSFAKVAVIGSGVMGSGISAHIANAGIPVLLLDIVPPNAEDRSVLARRALERMRAAPSSPFMLPKNADLVTVGNLVDDLHKLQDADWIIEVVLEDVKVKKALYASIDAVRKPGSIVSSNTSTITLNALLEGQSPGFRRDFLITHFFNPPRQMRLLEIVTGPETRADATAIVQDFCDHQLGKGVVHCKDTPGFIANRLGIFFLQAAVNAAFAFGVTVEEADAVFSKPFGMPSTGVFGLLDLIGIDLIPHIAASFMAALPAEDAYRAVNIQHPLVTKMIAEGFTGRKGKGGFYMMRRSETGKVLEAINLGTGDYHPSRKAQVAVLENSKGDLRAICESPDRIGLFVWRALSQVLAYAASLVPHIADDIVAIDTAMRLGFNWAWGPFELIDKLGAAWFATRLQDEGREVPPFLACAARTSFYRAGRQQQEYLAVDGKFAPIRRPSGVLLLSDVKRNSIPVLRNEAASLWNIGDGVVCLEFHTKMNTVDSLLLAFIRQAIHFVEISDRRYLAMVVHNESHVFSAGANLALMRAALDSGDGAGLETFIRQGQETYQAVRFAPFPVVAATAGLALGGGCEFLLHCSAVQAYGEAGMGLVEPKVGLVPGWGGCTQMLGRTLAKSGGDDVSSVIRLFEMMILATTAKTAFDAKALAYLRPADRITMNRDRLLFDAKQRALELCRDYRAPEPWKMRLLGRDGNAALISVLHNLAGLGKISPHDTVVGKSLADILCGDGGETVTAECDVLKAERAAFLNLARNSQTRARIDHMLATGKPLRN
jgi:3-hydroxyacyl-CoA dehydrogenase